jgi:hypothetical protein
LGLKLLLLLHLHPDLLLLLFPDLGFLVFEEAPLYIVVEEFAFVVGELIKIKLEFLFFLINRVIYNGYDTSELPLV